MHSRWDSLVDMWNILFSQHKTWKKKKNKQTEISVNENEEKEKYKNLHSGIVWFYRSHIYIPLILSLFPPCSICNGWNLHEKKKSDSEICMYPIIPVASFFWGRFCSLFFFFGADISASSTTSNTMRHNFLIFLFEIWIFVRW